MLIIGRALQGAGAVSAAVLALVADLTREAQRTKAMAIIGVSIGFSFLLSVILAPVLDGLMSRDRAVFEHFTHDASVLPMAFLPVWQRQFRRMKAKVAGSSWFGDALDADLLAQVMGRIRDEGPLSTRDFDTEPAGPRAMWVRPPHKKALDYLWYAGDLATSRRDGFTKVYDLAARVFPDDVRGHHIPDAVQVDWLCRAALERIGVGTLGEIRKFWDATEAAEVSAWAARATDTPRVCDLTDTPDYTMTGRAPDPRPLVPVSIEGADGIWTQGFGCPDIETRLAGLSAPTSRLRILNPFDPAIRDRARLKRLFGFDYTVEMFVPAAKRHWGYYVYPMLEGDRFVGRIEAKSDRRAGVLRVMNLWFEPGVRTSAARKAKIDAELARLCRLVGVDRVLWDTPVG
ncbi:MAG: DNA glycosylase AlkZ-like family protein, partial [Paracoccaceae bacterium]